MYNLGLPAFQGLILRQPDMIYCCAVIESFMSRGFMHANGTFILLTKRNQVVLWTVFCHRLTLTALPGPLVALGWNGDCLKFVLPRSEIMGRILSTKVCA